MKRCILIALIMYTYSQHALAYLDPGTGSMILQGIIAGVALGWLTMKNYWHKIRSFFGKDAHSSLLENDDQQKESEDVQ